MSVRTQLRGLRFLVIRSRGLSQLGPKLEDLVLTPLPLQAADHAIYCRPLPLPRARNYAIVLWHPISPLMELSKEPYISLYL